MIEGFEELKRFSNYLINKEGKIWSKKRNRFLSQRVDKGGYLVVNLCVECKIINKSIHRLLGIQYIENPNNLEFIDHIDKNKQNNSLDNLRWVDRMTNNNNKIKRGALFQECIRNYWKGKITIMGKTYEKVSKDKEVVEEWLKKIKEEHNIEC